MKQRNRNKYRNQLWVLAVLTSLLVGCAASPAAQLNADSIMTTAALYAPLDGMNEQGLCIFVNMIEDSRQAYRISL